MGPPGGIDQKTHHTTELRFAPYNYSRSVVLNLGLIEPQGFVESVSRVRQRSRILRLFSTIPFFEIHVLLVLFFEHSDFVCM